MNSAARVPLAYARPSFLGANSELSTSKVFRKTLAGHRALERDGESLRPESRRLLSLINGRLSGDPLAATVRSGEGAEILHELAQSGFVESLDTPARLDADQSAYEESLVDQRFHSARAGAERAARDLLGAHFSGYAAAFANCGNSRELRPLVDAVCERLTRTLGPDAATVFIECVRDAALNHRQTM